METGELVAKAVDKARDDSTPGTEFIGESWPACGYSTKDTIDDDDENLSELLKNPPAGGLLTGVKTFISEPAPPLYWHQAELAKPISHSDNTPSTLAANSSSDANILMLCAISSHV